MAFRWELRCRLWVLQRLIDGWVDIHWRVGFGEGVVRIRDKVK